MKFARAMTDSETTDEPDAPPEERPEQIEADEKEMVEELARLRAPVIYRIVSDEGRQELSRPATSIWWSGLAAGMALGLSIVMKGLLHHYLPDAPWRPAVESLGYPIGFLIVVLGRLQLFTENTLTAILPILTQPSRMRFMQLSKLWGLVFVANVAGALIAAGFISLPGMADPESLAAMREISAVAMDRGFLNLFMKGVPAGFLIAAMVWMMPSSHGFEFWVVLVMTYLIALGDFTHVIVGSTEVGLLMLSGQAGLALLPSFLIPAFFGNLVGGAGLFAMLAYAQVKKEV